MSIVKVFLASCITFVFVSACQTTDKTGNAPLGSMSDLAKDAYKQYLLVIEDYPRHNMVFLYDPDKKGFSWAGRKKVLGMSHAISEAMKLCRHSNPDRNCQVFDVNGDIVWKGISEELRADLLTPVELSGDTRIYEYSEEEFEISDRQKRSYRDYLIVDKVNDHSAFFVGSDGKSFGTAYDKGASTNERSKSVQRALQKCHIISKNVDTKCFLFAINGEPVNENARKSIEGS
jgi:hypothetical protein